MTQTLAGADIRGYYDALGISIPAWASTNASVSCFADPDAHHRGDRHPSCSINLEHGAWKCHGCGAAGGAYDAATACGYSARAAIDLMIVHGLARRRNPADIPNDPHGGRQRRPLTDRRLAEVPSRSRLGISEQDIRHWQAALTEHPELIARLTRERGWLYNTMLELKLGYDCGSITIPVHDQDRRLNGLLRYRPWPAAGQLKMRAARGSRRALLPHPATESARRLLLVEGEPDMIAARSQGLPAIAVPGADAWRPEWAQLLAGRDITIVMDCDNQGRAAANRIASDLRSVAHVIIFELDDRNDGYDLTDWLLDGKRKEFIWP